MECILWRVLMNLHREISNEISRNFIPKFDEISKAVNFHEVYPFL